MALRLLEEKPKLRLLGETPKAERLPESAFGVMGRDISRIAKKTATRFTEKEHEKPLYQRLFETTMQDVLLPGSSKITQLYKSFPQRQQKLITRFATAGVFPVVELYNLAKDVGIPLVKGEGVKGIDIGGREKSYREFLVPKIALEYAVPWAIKKSGGVDLTKLSPEARGTLLEAGVDIAAISALITAPRFIRNLTTRKIAPYSQQAGKTLYEDMRGTFTNEEISALTTKGGLPAYAKKHGIRSVNDLSVRFSKFTRMPSEPILAPERYYAGLPVPKDIIQKYKLRPSQVAQIKKGIFTNIPAEAVKELQKITPKVKPSFDRAGLIRRLERDEPLTKEEATFLEKELQLKPGALETKPKPPKKLFPEEDILAEYANKLEPEDVKEAFDKFSPQEIKAMEGELQNMENDPSSNLFRAIKELGGIKSYKGDYFKEELSEIPIYLRNNKTGQHIDTIIQELKNYGWHFEDHNELIDTISTMVRNGYTGLGKIKRTPKAIAKALKITIRPSITPSGKELPYTTEKLATQSQKAVAHILMKKKGLTPRQFEYLKNVMVGKKTMAGPKVARRQYVFEEGKPTLATEYKGKEPMTKSEAGKLIEAMKGIRPEPGKETVLARTRALVPGHKVTPYKLETLKSWIKKTNMPFDDVDTLVRLKGLDPDILTEKQANELLIDLSRASKLPEGERIRYFIKKPILKDKAIEKEYQRIEAHEGRLRASGFSGGRKNIQTGKDYHSPFYQSFKLSIPQSLKDVRLTMGDLEVKSGLPLYQHYLEISEAESLKEAELKDVTRILTRNIDKSLTKIESMKLQKDISDYFNAVYSRRPAPDLTEEEELIANDIREVMNKYKPFIKKYRFMQWVRSYRAGENEGQGFTDIPNVEQKTLKEGYDIWELQGEKALDEWLETKDFGVIDVGYIPRAILGGKARMIPYRIDAFTRKALKPRTADIDLSNIPLIPRIKRYINAVLNLKYMEKPIQSLDDTLNMASMGGHLPKETIARLSNWIDRAKGYAGVPSIPGKILTKIARQFFRVIVVRPFLWLRNLFQRVVTVPHKTPVMKLDFKPITSEEQKYFDTYISQMEEMEKSYLLFLRGQYTEIPILRQYSELSERVGRIYPITDESNRLSVFKKSLHYYNRAISDYVNRKLPLGILKNKVGYNLMRSYEQRHFLELLDKNPIEAGRWAAKWNVDNSQWLYKMSERSVAEMDEAVRPFFNLFVWSKGLLQNLGANIYKATRGRTWDEKRSGIIAIIGIIIASDLAQRCIQKITAARKRGRYDYNILNSMFWSLGGATLGMLNEGQEALSELVFAYQDGDRARKRRALSNALRMADRIAMFQLPFLEPALNVLEAITGRQYISPLYNALMKKPARIRRDFIEKIAHSIFGRVTQTKKKGKAKSLRLLR